MVELFDRLGRAGCDVSWSIGEEHAYEPGEVRADHDLYLLKSQAPAALSLAGVLDALGAAILNPARSCQLAQDKIVAANRLAAFGVRTPRTWASAEPGRLVELARAAGGPLVVKPFNGYHGTGVRFLPDASHLAQLPSSDTALVVQERVHGADDLKVYVIGDDVFGVRKAFDATSHGRGGWPVPLEPAVVELARRCGAAFGFGLYGVDVVETPDGPVAIDVNHFPGYKGVPDAAERLCAYVLRYASGGIDLRVPPLPRAPTAATAANATAATVSAGVPA
jgi:glutathione synthase/RimK-type ligase-like ATP-grasp enzyme